MVLSAPTSAATKAALASTSLSTGLSQALHSTMIEKVVRPSLFSARTSISWRAPERPSQTTLRRAA